MPRGDGTGPMGMGPMTGRAAGYCAGYQVPGYANPVPGRGFGAGFGRGRGVGFGRGMGFGFGRGFGWGFAGQGGYAPPYGGYPYPAYGAGYAPQVTQGQELNMLKTQAENFQNALSEIQKRIEELQAGEKQE